MRESRLTMTEAILEYYAEDGLSTMFHDVVARLEPGCRNDIGFYSSILTRKSARILELGCGSGRVSLELANKGHHVEGIDTAQPMLARAEFHRTRLDPSAASRVRFAIADMTSFSFPTKFDLVIGPYFALNHLPHRSAVMRTFKRVAEHLVTGGAFALHVANVARLARSLEQETTSKILVQYHPDGHKLRLEILERSYDVATGRFEQVLRYTMMGPDGSSLRTSAERLEYRAIEEEEVNTAAIHAGLIFEQKLGAGETGTFFVFRKTCHPTCFHA